MDLVPELRKAMLAFSFTFRNLDINLAQKLLKNASMKQENIQVCFTRTLAENFLYQSRPVARASGI
jgi:hypothetical protein